LVVPVQDHRKTNFLGGHAMLRVLKSNPLLWLGIGLVGGLLLSGIVPHTPLHATATDRVDTYAIATGPVDTEGDAVYFLDFLSGDLKAMVIGCQVSKFTAGYTRNILQDLGVDPAKNPRFMMVTGNTSFRGTMGNVRPGASVLYVAEVTSGKVAAYNLPWSTAMHRAPAGIKPIVLLDVASFRAAAGPAVGGPGTK
jgi:hypothetical protein